MVKSPGATTTSKPNFYYLVYIYIYCGCIFCFKKTHVLLGNFCLSHIGKIFFLFLPYKGWTNWVRVPLVWYSFIVGAFFASRKLMYSLAIFACPTLERSISFLSYKGWTNGVRVSLVWAPTHTHTHTHIYIYIYQSY